MTVSAAAFIDFEASGLMPGSFPIEAGWAIARRGRRKPAAASGLVRHDPWLDRIELWDSRAVQIHHIERRAILMMGKSPDLVATRMVEALSEFDIVYSDNADYDRQWCEMLFAAAEMDMTFTVSDWRYLFGHPDDDTDEAEFDRLHRQGGLAKIAPRTHRAKDDAYSMAMLWWASRRKRSK